MSLLVGLELVISDVAVAAEVDMVGVFEGRGRRRVGCP